MKLSEMSCDKAAETLIRLSGPLGVICDDEEAVEMIEDYKKRYRMPLFYAVGRVIPKLVAYLAQKHRAELYELVAILIEKQPKDIGLMNFAEVYKAVQDNYDDMLAVFIRSSGSRTMSAGGRSSAS